MRFPGRAFPGPIRFRHAGAGSSIFRVTYPATRLRTPFDSMFVSASTLSLFPSKSSETLLERYPEAFSEDFERNKELVAELTNIESKSVRNRVAGYVTHKQAGQVADA